MSKPLAVLFLTAALALPALAQTSSPLAKAKTVQVTETLFAPSSAGLSQPIAVMSVKMLRPGSVRVEGNYAQSGKGAGSDPITASVIVSDGKTLTEYTAYTVSGKHIRRQNTPPGFAEEAVGLHIIPSSVKPSAVILDGEAMQLFTANKNDGARAYVVKQWTNAATGLPYCQSRFVTENGKTVEDMRMFFTGWVLNAPLPPSTFQFTPPAGAKEVPK